MKKLILVSIAAAVASAFGVWAAYAGSTNLVIAIPTANAGGSSVIFTYPILTNATDIAQVRPGWTNVIDGPLNWIKVRVSVDSYYVYNKADATNRDPIVQANSIDNINLISPGVNITNICAREVGTTGNGTASVWISWQEPGENSKFSR